MKNYTHYLHEAKQTPYALFRTLLHAETTTPTWNFSQLGSLLTLRFPERQWLGSLTASGQCLILVVSPADPMVIPIPDHTLFTLTTADIDPTLWATYLITLFRHTLTTDPTRWPELPPYYQKVLAPEFPSLAAGNQFNFFD